MRYYNEVKSGDRKVALLFVSAYVVIAVVALIFVDFTVKETFREYPPKEGVLVALGDMQEGRGYKLLQKAKTQEAKVSTPASQPKSIKKAVKQNVPNASNKPTEIKDNDNAEDAVLQTSSAKTTTKKQVNKSALYSANNGSTSTSIGEKSGKGTMGSTQGSQFSDNHTITDGFSLDGRNIVGTLPRPRYTSNNEGRVVVNIQVNKEGKVTAATYRASGSTTSDSRLVSEAIAAARKARFNRDAGAKFIQTGTITYIYKVR